MSTMGRRAVVTGLGGALLGAAHAEAAVKTGQAATPFKLTTFAGEKITSDQLAGQVILLNYWATWCAPCRNEMVAFDKFLRPRLDKGLKIFAIATENPVSKRWVATVQAAIAYPLVSWFAGRGYGTIGGAVPTNYVIDRNGVVQVAKSGAFTLSSLDQTLSPLLAG